MKKFIKGNYVGLIMTENEYIMMRVLISSGVERMRKEEQYFFSDEMIEAYRKLREEECNYE